MDLRAYYQKIREIERGIAEEFSVLVSLDTADGGGAGLLTEAPRLLAAKMVAEGRARLASEEEAGTFREARAEAKRGVDQQTAASRLQVTVMTETAGRSQRGATRTSKQ